MNEHTICCGTVADKAKLCAEIEQRESVIRAQQRRIGELLQERDEALEKQVICASGCKEREALNEALAYAERVRDALSKQLAMSGGVEHGDAVYNNSVSVLSETPEVSMAAMKAKLQADAVREFADACVLDEVWKNGELMLWHPEDIRDFAAKYLDQRTQEPK